MKIISTLSILAALSSLSLGLDNGLARTPPMGWLAWERFRCNIDCENDPDNCISEDLFKVTADRMAKDGYLEAGYEYVILDDCWMSTERDENGRLQGDADRFPSGMKALADYIHGAGLKFGIYEDYGTHTCAGYPGVIDHMEIDAQTFADWEVDYVKLDGCNSDPATMDEGYPEFGRYLNATGRPMVYLCEWPLYQMIAGIKSEFAAIAETCNLWRNGADVEDSWSSVSNIIDAFAKNQDEIVPYAGPGHWNDPDMLIIGNFGLSYEESKAQMGIWAILASPLIMSVDLRTIKPEFADLYKNKGIIAINQDPLGIQGKRISTDDYVETWVRPVSPSYDNKYSFAVGLFNRRTDGTPFRKSVTLKDIGLDAEQGYQCQDAFEETDFGQYNPEDTFTTYVNPSGIVVIRCELNQPKSKPSSHVQYAGGRKSQGSLRKVGNFYVRDYVKF